MLTFSPDKFWVPLLVSIRIHKCFSALSRHCNHHLEMPSHHILSIQFRISTFYLSILVLAVFGMCIS